ncbi:hypothetical protein H5410_016443 [Solanum commersonii]|uniref:Uncharacterized protein n=1 Tax=Solanum commersonii TaxID=4109 RepID=A0A9J5ZX10_SOLCO|nr:hypothetical protein H5410_016443 [Solanum commersonii]
MTSSASSSKTPISQEVENPSPFNFFVLLPEESPSTSVCGIGQTDESINPLAKVVASLILSSEEILPCSLTLVLSCDKSQNSKAQSVAKRVDEPSTEEVEVASRVVSSTMYERFFERDLPEGKGPESNILAAGAELMVAVPDLETAKNSPEVDHIAKSTKSEKEIQKKKGKMVVSCSKGDKKRSRTRSETQKVMGSAIAASRVQTKRPTSTPLTVGSSNTESDDFVAYVAQRRKEGKEEKVKSKVLQKATKKSPVKKEKVKKGTNVKSSRAKGPCLSIQNLVADKKMTREYCTAEMKNQKMLNGWSHLFEPPTPYLHETEKMGGIKTTVKGVEILLDEETLGNILGVPVEGI